jgi:predicted phosphoribosyltransferase
MLPRRFKNRAEAGKRLAEQLSELRAKKPLVFAIPRGGVSIAYEIVKALHTSLDLIIPRKIGAPRNPELGIGAVTEDGTLLLNDDLVTALQVTQEYIEAAKKREIKEIKRRKKAYLGEGLSPSPEQRTVILVDDGIATGATVRAAVKSIRKQKPTTLIVAVPVAPPETLKKLEKEVDKVICLLAFEPFFAIGQFYEDFRQVSDEEVIEILKRVQ